MSFGSHPGRVVAIVTGGSFPAGLHVARKLARWAWPVVIVYLDHQSQAEATIAEIIAAGGTTISPCAPTWQTISTSTGCSPSP